VWRLPAGPLTIVPVKSWDAIVIGGGIIGLSLALALRKRGLKVLIVERGEFGREASSAAAGMLADCTLETPPALQVLASRSAHMYPEFVHELEDESGQQVDLREEGTILFLSPENIHERQQFAGSEIRAGRMAELELAIAESSRAAFLLKERSVDPRALVAAAVKAIKHRKVDTSSGDAVISVDLADGRVTGVRTEKTSFFAPVVINCAGAWSGDLGPHHFPTRPVKGQMLAVAAPHRNFLRHVVRSPEVYLVPRSDGRILIGSTLEEAGFEKRTDPVIIRRMYGAAVALVPKLSEARILEAWAGLRPGTPDALPILGPTSIPGYYVATGHFRNGILLTPVTAHLMAEVVCSGKTGQDIAPFSPARFSTKAA
jgi:glycine oxidase